MFGNIRNISYIYSIISYKLKQTNKMVNLTFNGTQYEFRFNYNTHKLHILKNGEEVRALDYAPIIVYRLSLTKCVEILVSENLTK